MCQCMTCQGMEAQLAKTWEKKDEKTEEKEEKTCPCGSGLPSRASENGYYGWREFCAACGIQGEDY